MSSKAWIWIAVVAIIVIGGIWYFTSASGDGSWLSGTATSTSATTTGSTSGSNGTTSGGKGGGRAVSETSGQGSINDLIALEKNLSCSFSQSTEYLRRSGTMYVSASGKLRGDFFSITNGKSANVSMIDDGKTLTVWTRGKTTGLQLSAGMSASGAAISNQGGIDPIADFDYECHPWTADESFFVMPAGVAFSSTTPSSYY